MRHEQEDTGRNGWGPGAHTRARAADSPDLTIVAPTRNEQAVIGAFIDCLDGALRGVRAELIVVDDSDDATPAVVAEHAGRAGIEVTLIHREPADREGGLGTAVVAGMAAARAPWVCVMDADLQHPPEAIAALRTQAEATDSDLVIASRFRDGGSIAGLSATRKLVSRSLVGLARVAFPSRLRQVTDPLTGFFLVRRDALDLSALRPNGFKILLEILIRSPALAVSEISFRFGIRPAGESKASVREVVRYLALVWRLRLGAIGARFGRFGLVGLERDRRELTRAGSVSRQPRAERPDSRSARDAVLIALELRAARAIRLPRRLRAAAPARTGHRVLRDEQPRLPDPRPIAVRPHGLRRSALPLRQPRLHLHSHRRALRARRPLDLGHRRQDTGFYDIHDLVTVESEVALPELARFRVRELAGPPSIRVTVAPLAHIPRLGQITRDDGIDVITYREAVPRGFAVRFERGDRVVISVSPLVRRSPHVLYTNCVEPVLRWHFAEHGVALVHAACVAVDDRAFLITALTDTGKTTTILRLLDSHPRAAFISDDLTLVGPDGSVAAYPKPLTISQHTLHAVRTPNLTRRERLGLVVQARLHSREGRSIGMLLASKGLPAATMNAVVQTLIPPPKYDIEKLVPDVRLCSEAHLSGLIVIERADDDETSALPAAVALDTLMANCDDAYGFPPYPLIAQFLYTRAGVDLRAAERGAVSGALAGAPATLLRSTSMDWWQRVPAVIGIDLDDAQIGTELPVSSAAIVVESVEQPA